MKDKIIVAALGYAAGILTIMILATIIQIATPKDPFNPNDCRITVNLSEVDFM